MSPTYRAVLFDLFGTLITVDASTLPTMTVEGRSIRSTVPVWASQVQAVCPGVDAGVVARALRDASADLARDRATTHREIPARERFRAMLRRLGCPDDVAAVTAPTLVRGHMRAIADTTRFPAAHRLVLEHAASVGPVAIVTNFDDTAGAYEILERHGMRSLVATVVVSEAVGLRKPHPALVTIALRDLEAAADATLMVGDTLADDVGAAVAAGVDAAWIDPEGRGPDAAGPQPRWAVRTLPDVVALLTGSRKGAPRR